MKRKKSPPAAPGVSGRTWLGAILVAAGVGVVVYSAMGGRNTETTAPAQAPAPAPAPRAVNEPVPPYHESAEAARPFPALLDPGRFEAPVIARAYEIAHEIPEVLAQQPCYCNCGVFGHGSLLDCFASEHGAT